jgi:hypothetical protein
MPTHSGSSLALDRRGRTDQAGVLGTFGRKGAMLAYIFWHRPYASADAAQYEALLLRFQGQLVAAPPPGFRGAVSYRIAPVPWLGGQSGYEDWAFVEGSWALDPLNNFAVTGAVAAPHDNVAAQMDVGHGGLYRLMWGDAEPPAAAQAVWLTRPRGINWRAALDPLHRQLAGASCWRRQMVLGPGPEFVIVAPAGATVTPPADWTALPVARTRLAAPA